MSAISARAFCRNCHRVTALCLCGDIRGFDAGFSLILLVHPREARRTIGTARIVHRSVRDSELIVGRGDKFDTDPGVLKYLESPRHFAAVLFPGSDALDLGSAEVSGALDGKRLALFVIDGTWHQAKSMIARSRRLAGLPKLAFTPERRSEYEFRKQPREQCLSTVEAVHHVIESLARASVCPAPEGRKHDRMLLAFRKLVSSQVELERAGRAMLAPGNVPEVDSFD